MENKTTIKEKIYKNINIHVSLTIFLIFIILSIVSNYNDFLSSIYGNILIRSVLFIAFLCLLYIKKLNITIIEYVYDTFFAIFICYLSGFFSLKIFSLISLIYGVLGLIIYIINYLLNEFKNKKKFSSWTFIIILFSLIFSVDFLRKAYFDFGIMLIIVSAIITFILTIAFLVYKYKITKNQNIKYKKVPKWLRIVGDTFSSILIVFSLSYIILTSININFDFKVSATYDCEIVDKDMRSHYRGPTTYTISVLLNNKEIDLGVTNSLYKEVTIGDYINVSYLEGALKEGFYIISEYL